MSDTVIMPVGNAGGVDTIVKVSLIAVLGYGVVKLLPGVLEKLGSGKGLDLDLGFGDTNVHYGKTVDEVINNQLVDEVLKPAIGPQGQRADGSYIIGGNNWTNNWSQPVVDFVQKNAYNNMTSDLGQAFLTLAGLDLSVSTGSLNPVGVAANQALADAAKAAAEASAKTSNKSSGGSGYGSAKISDSTNTSSIKSGANWSANYGGDSRSTGLGF